VDQLSQWFQSAAGFSGESLSIFIRTLIFLLSVVWGAFIVKGMLTQMNESDDPMSWFVKLVLVLILLVAIWVIIY
jgi:hypothetical protein